MKPISLEFHIWRFPQFVINLELYYGDVMLARHQHESVKLAITRRSYYRYLISDLLQFTLPPPTVSPAHPVTPPTDSPSLSLSTWLNCREDVGVWHGECRNGFIAIGAMLALWQTSSPATVFLTSEAAPLSSLSWFSLALAWTLWQDSKGWWMEIITEMAI